MAVQEQILVTSTVTAQMFEFSRTCCDIGIRKLVFCVVSSFFFLYKMKLNIF